MEAPNISKSLAKSPQSQTHQDIGRVPAAVPLQVFADELVDDKVVALRRHHLV